MRLTLATWNVHGWVGRDDVRNPERSWRVAEALAADVVALQEVEGSDWERLAREAGYKVLLGHPGPRVFGNALLTRRPVPAFSQIDLSMPGREPRAALDAVVEHHGAPFRVVATHLGLAAGERRRQAAVLADRLRDRDGGEPCVLLGDFNDWTPWALQLRALARFLGPFSRVATFPSHRPVLALDRFTWRAPGWAGRVVAVRSPEAQQASDHLPLRLELTELT